MNAERPLQAFINADPEAAGGQLLRVRLLGRGPALAMFHESPRSSAALLPLAERLAERFTCVMLDTPGFGLSDPLPLSRPEIPDFAQMALAALDQLNIGRALFYGTHTGAAVVAEAAYRAPDKVRAALLDGYAMFSPAERDELLAAYLPAFRHSVDGSHVAWLWSRVRDQFSAFPWHRVADAGRLPFGPPPLAFQQAVVDDFLLADDHYRGGYSAAFRYDHLYPVRRVTVPVYVAARRDDLLYPHLQNATELPDCARVVTLPADRDAWGRRIAELLQAHADGQPQTDAATLLAQLGRPGSTRAYIANTSAGPLLLRFDGKSSAPPLLLLHDVPGGLHDLDHLAQRLARRYRVIRPELPGVGASQLETSGELTIDVLQNGLREALSDFGLQDCAAVACGASLPLALGICAAHAPLIALDPWPQVATGAVEQLPDLTPRWDGSHLFAAFYWARDYDLYKPWYHRVNADGRELGGERDVQRLHQRFRAVVLGGNNGAAAAKALYQRDCGAALRECAARCKAMLYRSDADHDALLAWARPLLGDAGVSAVPRDAGALAAAIDDALTGLH